MASLKLEHIYKVYSNGHKAVSDFNMEIEDGEFIVFVGPSGCGKSTTLRMIAGLEDITSGELYIGEDLVNDMQPKDRDIAMVFQNYALYPHMTVYENMAFGLTLRKVPRSEIHEKVMWAADVLGLREYLDRKPKAMSGGQRQRVSLGRAILRNPKVMLLDEPLSNLDAKLRSQMRSMISKLHQQLKTTFIYVTHDQVEAMTLGTRVVVMKLGFVQQIDTPQNLYDHPVNKFVAGFIGTPQMNFFNVTLKEEKDCVLVNWTDCDQKPLKLPKDFVLKAEKKFLQGDKNICMGFRCQHVTAENIKDGDNVVNVVVSHFEELGNETLIYGDLKAVEGLGEESKTPIIIKASSKLGYKEGDVIKAKIDVDKIHLFDAETEMTIIPAIPDHNVLPCEIINEKLSLFGTITKPDSIAVDLLKNGSISIPLSAIKVGAGKDKAKVVKVETIGKTTIALVECTDKKFFVKVDANTKVGDFITFSVDYSKATFIDDKEMVVCAPLADRDNLMASFVNLKTAIEVTEKPEFDEIRTKRVEELNAKYEKIEADFISKRDNALANAQREQERLASGVGAKQEELNKENYRLSQEMAKAKVDYKNDLKAAKIKHKEIGKTEIAKIEKQYKDMWENEKADFKDCMLKNKDSDSRRARRNSYSLFKESFPLMKQNDLERKTNSLDFDKETELNAIQAKYTQTKGVNKDAMKENKRKFKEENFPYTVAKKEYDDKWKALQKKKKDETLRANLVFFFKYDTYYEVIPDDITNKIIQGMGEKVFTKTFRVEVPHDGFVEAENALPFKVVALVNYGDVKMYKCVGNIFGQKTTVYINKTKEIEIGTTLSLAPVLNKTQIYEDERNIRLY